VIHGAAVFGGTGEGGDPAPEREEPAGRAFAVAADRLYRELVPFGPAWRNARDPILLFDRGAEALVAAPAGRGERLLGSPYPLDAALHVACAWCQRYGDTVAFPVGFRRRRVVHPIGPGETCRVRVEALGAGSGSFLFDLVVRDKGGRPREVLSGVRMRDVSGGRLRPPAWIRA
jgi:hypothetical protein